MFWRKKKAAARDALMRDIILVVRAAVKQELNVAMPHIITELQKSVFNEATISTALESRLKAMEERLVVSLGVKHPGSIGSNGYHDWSAYGAPSIFTFPQKELVVVGSGSNDPEKSTDYTGISG